MTQIVCRLDAESVDSDVFGPKASMLNRLTHLIDGRVPPGFCVSAKADLSEVSVEREIAAAIRQLGTPDGGRAPLIVRSSALVEDLPGYGFAGRFESVSNNLDIASVIQAIGAVRNSALSPRVQEYRGELGLAEQPLVACIVQREIKPTHSGVIFTKSPLDPDYMMLEMVKGNASRLLRGQVAGRAFHIKVEDGGDIRINSLNARGIDTLPLPIDQLMGLVKTVSLVLGKDKMWDIEWCVDRSPSSDTPPEPKEMRFYIVQAREVLPTSQESVAPPPLEFQSLRPAFTPGFPDGTKAYAASLFQRLGIGAPGLITVRRNENLGDVRAELESYEPGPLGTTVRFSNPTSDIGLRRDFIPRDETDLAGKFFQARGDRSDLFGIVHHYVPPDHSFEAYLDASFLVVEHVPGIWEADSSVPPDLFVFEHGEEPVIWRYTKRRQAVLKRPGQQLVVEVDPIQKDVLTDWATYFERTFRRVRRGLPREISLPVNMHFIGSRQDDDGIHKLNYSFLNLRLTPRLRIKAPKISAFHVVNSVSDMATWDGRTSLLLRVTFDRGDERQGLVPIAKQIHARSQGVPGARPAVYAEFGILSHPAIVLREFGVDVQPIHTDHEVVHLNDGK